MLKKILVWDLPVRIFHWALVVCVSLSLVTAQLENDWIIWHAYCGYIILALLLFRLSWGFIGSFHARFVNFIPSRSELKTYLNTGLTQRLGHNPLGALSVFAMLGVLLIQVVTGLFIDDEISFQGPLQKYISNDWASSFTSIHHLNQWLIYILLGIHVGVIFYYWLIKGNNLVFPMIFGYKKINQSTNEKDISMNLNESLDQFKDRVKALIVILSMIIFVIFIVQSH